VFVAGTSAGAQLAALAGLSGPPPAAVIGLGGYWGPVDRSASLAEAVAGAGASAPPFFVRTSSSTRSCRPRLLGGSPTGCDAWPPRPVAYAELPGGQHTFDLFHSIRFEAVVDAIDAFATCATGWREARGRSEARSAGRGRD
jgi:hypothetical protein